MPRTVETVDGAKQIPVNVVSHIERGINLWVVSDNTARNGRLCLTRRDHMGYSCLHF